MGPSRREITERAGREDYAIFLVTLFSSRQRASFMNKQKFSL